MTMHYYGTGTLVSRFTQRQPCVLSWLLQHILYISRAPGMGAYHQCATASSIRHYTLYYILLVPTCDSICTVCLRIIMFHHSVTICVLAVYHFELIRRERVHYGPYKVVVVCVKGCKQPHRALHGHHRSLL